jgi:hypothetical protein
MKSITGRVPKDSSNIQKKNDHSSEGDQQKEYKEEKHALKA